MKLTAMVITAASLLACHAYAGEAYQDPSDNRAPGVITQTNGVKLMMRDADPFQFRIAGSPEAQGGVLPGGGSEAGLQTSNSLPDAVQSGATARYARQAPATRDNNLPSSMSN